ncbi:hypothetical protein TNCV_2558361 [Trichonephila clavipes]|nr:hypothetical protein TNCV_2558361 [Trichonephila clavipes]
MMDGLALIGRGGGQGVPNVEERTHQKRRPRCAPFVTGESRSSGKDFPRENSFLPGPSLLLGGATIARGEGRGEHFSAKSAFCDVRLLKAAYRMKKNALGVFKHRFNPQASNLQCTFMDGML